MLSQTDLAIRTEVSQSAISSVESDKSVPNSVMLHRIARELGVDINDLLRDENSSEYHSNKAINYNHYQEIVNIAPQENIIKSLLMNQKKITDLIEAQQNLMELLLKNTFFTMV